MPSLQLYPGSTVEFSNFGQCAVIRNISDSIVYVPLTAESWPEFLRAKYPAVEVQACGHR